MNELLQNFVESLREELRQYGELLALLEAQQEQVVRRLADELSETVSGINSQAEVIQAARRERDQRRRELARSLLLPDETLINQLIPALPESYRPLVSALVGENNHLLARVQQRARRNHILLSRSLELMGQFINSLCAVGAPTYNEVGAMAPAVSAGRALYEAVG
jgi:FlgN protein